MAWEPPATPSPGTGPNETPQGQPYATPTTGPDANDPIASGEYPPVGDQTPADPDYPFPVQDPTQPGFGTNGQGPTPGVPVEYQPPPTRTYDPTYGGPRPPHHPRMPNDPFQMFRQDQETEYGWGEGMYPDPILDYSAGGSRSRFPIADPDRQAQHRNLAAIRRTDVSSASAPIDPYCAGNPDRFGAGPPLVRKKGRYKPSKYTPPKPPRMRREW